MPRPSFVVIIVIVIIIISTLIRRLSCCRSVWRRAAEAAVNLGSWEFRIVSARVESGRTLDCALTVYVYVRRGRVNRGPALR